MPGRIFVGTAGWSIPRASAHRCSTDGTHLERYSRTFCCSEINSSFHRPHAPATYAKWASSTPSDFRFAVKLPRTITHDQQLRRARVSLERFLNETGGLGRKRGPLLVQLPPSLSFESRVAGRFFEFLRDRYEGLVVCEPRHETWFSGRAEALLVRFKVGRVAADPAPTTGADAPGGWPGIVSSTGCTVRRRSTGRGTGATTSEHSGRRCAPSRRRLMRGACSTTPRVARRSTTRMSWRTFLGRSYLSRERVGLGADSCGHPHLAPGPIRSIPNKKSPRSNSPGITRGSATGSCRMSKVVPLRSYTARQALRRPAGI